MRNIFLIFLFFFPTAYSQNNAPTTEKSPPKIIVNWPADGYPSAVTLLTKLNTVKSKELIAAKDEVRKEFPDVIRFFFSELKKNPEYTPTDDDIASAIKSFEDSVSTVNILTGLEFLYDVKNFRLFLIRRADLVWKRSALEKIKSLELEIQNLNQRLSVLDKNMLAQTKSNTMTNFKPKKPVDFYQIISIFSIATSILLLAYVVKKDR